MNRMLYILLYLMYWYDEILRVFKAVIPRQKPFYKHVCLYRVGFRRKINRTLVLERNLKTLKSLDTDSLFLL